MAENAKKTTREQNGVVVSDAMDKTVVVAVNTLKTHAKYKKRYTVTKRYKAHDESNTYKVGDEVTIRECRPISKGKRWMVVDLTANLKNGKNQ